MSIKWTYSVVQSVRICFYEEFSTSSISTSIWHFIPARTSPFHHTAIEMPFVRFLHSSSVKRENRHLTHSKDKRNLIALWTVDCERVEKRAHVKWKCSARHDTRQDAILYFSLEFNWKILRRRNSQFSLLNFNIRCQFCRPTSDIIFDIVFFFNNSRSFFFFSVGSLLVVIVVAFSPLNAGLSSSVQFSHRD